MTAITTRIGFDEPLDRRHWRWGILSSLADYIDAGSIVAGAAALVLWQEEFGYAAMMAVTVVVGVVYGPNSQGRSLEEIQEEQLRTHTQRRTATAGDAGGAS